MLEDVDFVRLGGSLNVINVYERPQTNAVDGRLGAVASAAAPALVPLNTGADHHRQQKQQQQQ